MSKPFLFASAQRQALTGIKGKKHSRGAVLQRRICFLVLFIFWSIKHRSTKHAAWIAAYEGYPWN